jgi:hypothetical protein
LITILAGGLAASMPQPAAAGMINLDLRVPPALTFHKGELVPVEVWFVSSTAPSTDWSSADIIFEWSPILTFSSFTDEPIPNLTSNTSAKQPAENGIVWSGSHVSFGGVFSADDAPGTHVTTLNLKAVDVGAATIRVLVGDLGADTVVYDGDFNEITGTKGGTEVAIELPEPATVLLLMVGLPVFRTRGRIL